MSLKENKERYIRGLERGKVRGKLFNYIILKVKETIFRNY